jgi:PAS domain S-box-containing protein
MLGLGECGSRLIRTCANLHPTILTIAILAVATLLRLLFTPVLGSGYAFITYYPAIIFSTIIGGWKYGLFASVASEALAVLVFIDPIAHLEHAAALLLFFLLSGMMIASAEVVLHRRRQAERETDLVLAREEALRQEVSARKRAEEALRDSEDRFRTLGDHMSQFAWMIDQSGDAVWFNRRWYEYTGATFEEMRGWGWRKVHHPQHEERVVASWRQAFSSGDSWEETFPLRGADGRYRWFLTRAVPIHNAEGHIVRWFGTNTDITALRDAAAALRESQERLRAIVETAVDGIITIDESGTIQSINPAVERIFQYPKEELIGQNVKILMPAPDHHRHDGYLQQYRETGERKIIGIGREVSGRRKDGSTFPIELSISESTLPGNRFFTGILRDITQRKMAEDELRVMTVELDKRVAVRTQELVQSQDRLRALATELNLAEQRERTRLAEELHDHLQQMLVLGKLKVGQAKQSTPVLADLIKEFEEIFSTALTYTRTLVAELSPPVLREQGLAEALKWLGEYMKKYGMVVKLSVPEKFKLELAENQKVLLFQSVRELLINSSKHSGSHEAWVTLEQVNGQLRIHVLDKGVGFDLAFVATSAKPASEGTLSSQFGLFSIRERMKALGGKLDIRSSPGSGTAAILELPVIQPEETQDSAEGYQKV